MSKYLLKLEPGFRGNKEGWKYYERFRKLTNETGAITKDGLYLKSVSYNVDKSQIKKMIQSAIQAGQGFYTPIDVNIYVEDASGDIYSSGSFKHVTNQRDYEYVYISIQSKDKPNKRLGYGSLPYRMRPTAPVTSGMAGVMAVKDFYRTVTGDKIFKRG